MASKEKKTETEQDGSLKKNYFAYCYVFDATVYQQPLTYNNRMVASEGLPSHQ